MRDDNLNQLVSGTSTAGYYAGARMSWSYDSYGNRTAQSFTNSANSNWATYNSANNRIATASTALAGYVYDASGNTLNDGNNEYWYDAEGQLCAVQSQAVAGLPVTQYIYDAEGARIGKGTLAAAPSSNTSLCAPPLSSGFTITARYLVDLGGGQVTELSEQSGEVWKHSNVFSAARLTATYDTSGLHYALADPLGTKRIQANISGQIEESCVSLPFGDALNCAPTALTTADDATEHHFTQKERDNESGNDYFFARYYNSAIGRFTTPDWSAKVVPVPYAQMGDPQSLNLYAYVGNNPLTHEDDDGHADEKPQECYTSEGMPTGEDRVMVQTLMGEQTPESYVGMREYTPDQSGGIMEVGEPTGPVITDPILDQEAIDMVSVMNKLGGLGDVHVYEGYPAGEKRMNAAQHSPINSGQCRQLWRDVYAVQHQKENNRPYNQWRGQKQVDKKGNTFIRKIRGATRVARTDFFFNPPKPARPHRKKKSPN